MVGAALILALVVLGDAAGLAQTSVGYRTVTLAALRAAAPTMAGEKVAVSARVIVVDEEIGTMFENASDPDRVWLKLGQASRETRTDLMTRCRSIDSPCQATVRGQVEVKGADIALVVD